ncbi:hypothetical protein GW17_00012995 [Ensete ventricosum]|nr:hypothetical protein GW17_00012995 [Ensete ventricosum]
MLASHCKFPQGNLKRKGVAIMVGGLSPATYRWRWCRVERRPAIVTRRVEDCYYAVGIHDGQAKEAIEGPCGGQQLQKQRNRAVIADVDRRRCHDGRRINSCELLVTAQCRLLRCGATGGVTGGCSGGGDARRSLVAERMPAREGRASAMCGVPMHRSEGDRFNC